MESFEKKAHFTPEEKAILIAVQRPRDIQSFAKPLAELENLAQTVGVEILGSLMQRRGKFHPGTYLGKGKIDELKQMTEELEATLIIANDDLSPSQGKSLEDATGVRVIDRTELILDIFALHAKTKEATIQVELAQMEYVLPRLKRMWTHLEGSQGGVGFRGPGEKQIETDRQIIKKKIADCTNAIKKIKERKEREVLSRNKRFFTVGLVGYTNAGKSSLMNALTDSDVLVEDKLFATLDTKTRLWDIAQGRKVLLSDTVGFIDKLPHHLVASFKATLEEASQSDILLHIVDCSHPDAERHIKVVGNVLRKLKLDHKQQLLVLNKIDCIEDTVDFENLKTEHPDSVSISAKKKINLDELSSKILSVIEANMVEIDAVFPVQDGKLLSWMREYTRVIEQKVKEESLCMRISLSKANLDWLKAQNGVEISACAVN